jgi:hypothetical protein
VPHMIDLHAHDAWIQCDTSDHFVEHTITPIASDGVRDHAAQSHATVLDSRLFLGAVARHFYSTFGR